MIKEIKKCLKERVKFLYPDEKVVDVDVIKMDNSQYLGFVTTITKHHLINSYRYVVEKDGCDIKLVFDRFAIAEFDYMD